MSDSLTKQTKVLLATVEILDVLKYEYFLCNGTLLGIIRDSQLIPWDIDLDIGVGHEIDKDRLCAEFVNRGYELDDYGAGSNYLALKSKDVKVDFNFFYPRDQELVTLWQVPRQGFIPQKIISSLRLLHLPLKLFKWCWTLEGYALPTNQTLPVSEIEFQGRTVKVPANPEEVLAYTYGKTWRVTKKDYNWRTDGENNARG